MDRSYSHSQPFQDLAGVKTWVEKNRQDGLQEDSSSPDPSRPDYADGEPQRDRVLPLPSGHPKGRDEQRAGPPIHNVPSDSAGNTNKKPKSEFAISDHPDGKPLHKRPRSSGVPGDEYGNPHIDQSQSTGLKRRVLSSEIESAYTGRGKINIRPPKRRQRKTKGRVRRIYDLYRKKVMRTNRSKQIQQRRRYYRRNKRRILMYQKRRRQSPERYKRYEGGGYSSPAKKNKDMRNKRKASYMLFEEMKKQAVLDVMSAMYKEVLVPLDGTSEVKFSEEIEGAVYKRGPGSRSRPKQQRQRAKRKRQTGGSIQQARRRARAYYRKNKSKIKRRVKSWRRKHKNTLKRYKRPGTRRASDLQMLLNISCQVLGCDVVLYHLNPIQNIISMGSEVGYLEMPLSHFFAFVDWQDPNQEKMLEEIYVESLSDYFSMRTAGDNEPIDPDLWEDILDLVRGDRSKEVCKNGECSQPVKGGEGFETYPSAYANGYAAKEYKRLGGKWRKKKASMPMNSLTALQIFLACLRGAHWAHWTSHWQVKGSPYYGDHLLMERLYTGLVEEIDTLAEKIVGSYGPEAVAPVDQAQIMANALLPIVEMQSQDHPILRALFVEEALQKVFKRVYDYLQQQETLSLGMDDFIMSLASAHETNVYLLRQRLRG
jgi:DNA-binding ferritin-like protein